MAEAEAETAVAVEAMAAVAEATAAAAAATAAAVVEDTKNKPGSLCVSKGFFLCIKPTVENKIL